MAEFSEADGLYWRPLCSSYSMHSIATEFGGRFQFSFSYGVEVFLFYFRL